MVNPLNSTYPGAIQCYTNFKGPERLSDGTCLQGSNINQQPSEQTGRYDTLGLTPEQSQVTLDVPEEITTQIPRAWTIMSETLSSYNDHLQASLDKANGMNLSFGERLAFLKEEGQKWVEDKRQNDPEMFVAWLKIHKESIQQGEGYLVGLPSGFTMEDYYSYVGESFSTFA